MRRTLTPVILGFLMLLAAAGTFAQKEKPIESFTAFAASLQSGRASPIDIVINRWSTDAERDMLLETLQEGGEDKLLAALEKIRPPVGYMRTPNSLGYDLYFARSTPQPDGSRNIVLATNRRVSFREAANSGRSMQYQFNVIQLHIGKDGKGEGKMVPAAKVTWDAKAKRIEIENFNALPVDLMDVKEKKG